MAVNFALTDADRLTVPDDDPLGRTWVGWDSTATEEDLWQVNRGLWRLGSRINDERIATLSYGGRIQVVAEITDRNSYEIDGVTKWTLSGTVLAAGDPVHDELKGSPAPPGRNPTGYFDTSHLDSVSTADRANLADHEPSAMIVTWNPEKWNPDGWDEHVYPWMVDAVAGGAIWRGQWATGGRKSGIEPGDRVFFLRQGVDARGVIGSGTAASRIFNDTHWDEERDGDGANYVLIDWDTLVAPDDGLPHSHLVEQIPEGGIWRPQASGWLLPSVTAQKLETLWAAHLGRSTPLPRRSTPRQGWQLDPARRKKVENAAQDRLMSHYRDEGWTIQDVRHGNPYDAVATKAGRTLWLEAKGTETAGASVIVTPGEVRWAREHPGDCVMGVLSDVMFRPDGDVDPTSGTFRIFAFDPDIGGLEPRSFDFTPRRA